MPTNPPKPQPKRERRNKMADINPSDVKKLRDATGAGMLDCKNALIDAKGDFEEAQKILRKKGLAAATKREGRATTEGRLFIAIRDGKAAICELTCETYFVAGNEKFKAFGEEIVNMILDAETAEITPEIADKVKEAISIIKENMTLKRIRFFKLAANQKAYGYSHDGQIASVVILESDNAAAFDNAAVAELGNDIAMHITAFHPQFISEETVPQKFKDEQMEIFAAQSENLNKPADVLQKIMAGKLNKIYSEVCLTKQAFVKDDKQSVEKVIAAVAKQAGAALKPVDYVYYKVGIDE